MRPFACRKRGAVERWTVAHEFEAGGTRPSNHPPRRPRGGAMTEPRRGWQVVSERTPGTAPASLALSLRPNAAPRHKDECTWTRVIPNRGIAHQAVRRRADAMTILYVSGAILAGRRHSCLLRSSRTCECDQQSAACDVTYDRRHNGDGPTSRLTLNDEKGQSTCGEARHHHADEVLPCQLSSTHDAVPPVLTIVGPERDRQLSRRATGCMPPTTHVPANRTMPQAYPTQQAQSIPIADPR
jgi:hypothetical protein